MGTHQPSSIPKEEKTEIEQLSSTHEAGEAERKNKKENEISLVKIW